MVAAAPLAAALPAAVRLAADRAHRVLVVALILSIVLLLLACVASPCLLRPRPGENVPCAAINRYFLFPVVSTCATLLALLLWRSEDISTTLAMWLAVGLPLATLVWVVILCACHVAAVGEIRCLEADHDTPPPPRQHAPMQMPQAPPPPAAPPPPQPVPVS